ncbi:MAG: D-alanyl-D-alanine carboxypeptidase/D-alanyl-D-alanine-endopeptidase [Gemmatimonadota bacterium]
MRPRRTGPLFALAALVLMGCSGVAAPPGSPPPERARPASGNGSAAVATALPAPDTVRDTVYVVREAAPADREQGVFVPLEVERPEGSALTRPAASGDPAVIERVAAIIDRPPFDQMHWGIVAKDLHDGHLLLSLNAHHKFAPASNMKVLAGAAALSALGPEHRFRTPAFATGPLSGGTVRGALVVVGSGDPSFSDAFHPSWRTPFDRLADSLLAVGARRFDGPLVIDVAAWDSTSVPGSWMVEDLGWSWGASGGAFVVAGGQVALTLDAPSTVGAEVPVRSEPRLASGRLELDVRTAATDTAIVHSRPLGENGRIRLSGRVPPRWRRTLRIAQGDPVRVAGELLYQVLTERGIRFDGGLAFAWEREAELPGGCAAGRIASCPAAHRLATLTSPPLMELLDAALGPSDNWIMDQLTRALAQSSTGTGGWEQAGDAVAEELGRAYNVLAYDVDVVDGSGLSAYNLATPRALVDVLTQIRIRPEGERFRRALAEPGEAGTTLSGRLGSLGGRVFAKTGSLTHTNSLSGYLVRDNGRELVFSILTNASGLDGRAVRDVIDALVVELARW